MAGPFGFGQTYVPQFQSGGVQSFAPGSMQQQQMQQGQPQGAQLNNFGPFGQKTQQSTGAAQLQQLSGAPDLGTYYQAFQQQGDWSNYRPGGLEKDLNGFAMDPKYLRNPNMNYRTGTSTEDRAFNGIGGHADVQLFNGELPQFQGTNQLFSDIEGQYRAYFNNLNAYKQNILPEQVTALQTYGGTPQSVGRAANGGLSIPGETDAGRLQTSQNQVNVLQAQYDKYLNSAQSSFNDIWNKYRALGAFGQL